MTASRSRLKHYVALMAVCCLATASSQMRGSSSPADLAATYSQAEELIRNHQWDQGLALLQQLLKREPNDLKVLNLTGLAYTGEGDAKRADTYFERILKTRPEFVPALKNLAINEFGIGQLQNAERHLEMAAKQSPGDPVINLYLGEIAYREHKFRRSAKHLSLAGDFLAHNPNVLAQLAISDFKIDQAQKAMNIVRRIPPESLNPQSQFALGVALAETGHQKAAIPYFLSLRHSYPDSYDAGYDLTICYLDAKQYPAAISVANDLVRSGHETAKLENALAEAYVGNKEVQPAIDSLRRAISLDPQNEDNYLDFASLCMDQRDFDAGLKVLQVGIQIHPRSYRLFFERGILYAMQDRFDLAEKDFTRSSELDPKNDLGSLGLGATYLEAGNAVQAVHVLKRRVLQNPDDANLLYLLGEALMRSGASPGSPAFAEAQAALEKSVRLNPKLCLPHVSLGNIYLEENKPDAAVTQLKQALIIDPKQRSALSHLAIAYRRLGQTESARNTLNSLKEIVEHEQAFPREKVKTVEEGPRN
jgi:predicted Zn-dependent protease